MLSHHHDEVDDVDSLGPHVGGPFLGDPVGPDGIDRIVQFVQLLLGPRQQPLGELIRPATLVVVLPELPLYLLREPAHLGAELEAWGQRWPVRFRHSNSGGKTIPPPSLNIHYVT